jgi:hypothetical protein
MAQAQGAAGGVTESVCGPFVPAKAGTQEPQTDQPQQASLGSRFRGNERMKCGQRQWKRFNSSRITRPRWR